MITAPLSATDTFNPAMERTKHFLFKPFRFAIWWRIAFIAIFAGELSGSNFNFNMPSNFRMPSRSGSNPLPPGSPLHLPSLHEILPWIVVGAVIVIVLMFLFMWISSIMRFVLFDAVLSGKVRIRDGWRRWQECGNSFFPWKIGYMFAMLALYALVFGAPIYMAWRAGIFRDPSQHIGTLILGGLALVFLALIIGLAGLAIYVLTKDFVVPIMAFEGVGPIEGWRRLNMMIAASKGSYAGYLGFKVILAIAAGIIIGIASLIIFMIVLIPAIIFGVFIGIAGAAGGTGLSAFTITILIVGGIVVGLLLLFVISMISVPVVVFFQSYALHFFGSRYEPLRKVLYPEPPTQTPPGFVPQPAI